MHLDGQCVQLLGAAAQIARIFERNGSARSAICGALYSTAFRRLEPPGPITVREPAPGFSFSRARSDAGILPSAPSSDGQRQLGPG
jgi:hypothetical protein